MVKKIETTFEKVVSPGYVSARYPKSTKDALRQLAAQRGETEAQYIRDLIDWQTRAVLRGETDAEMRAPPAQAKADLQLAQNVRQSADKGMSHPAPAAARQLVLIRTDIRCAVIPDHYAIAPECLNWWSKGSVGFRFQPLDLRVEVVDSLPHF